MPWWQSMQVMPSSIARWWFAAARVSWMVKSMYSKAWQFRHSRLSVAFILRQTEAAMCSRRAS